MPNKMEGIHMGYTGSEERIFKGRILTSYSSGLSENNEKQLF